MKELNKKKYVTLITIIILVMGIIGIINVGNIDLDKGKVKLKSASIEKLKSSVIESKGYEEITYPVLYELEKVDGIEERTVIIKGTLTKEENKYARFKEITSNNITSTVSENGRKIEIKIEKVKLGRQNKINLKIEINGAINETKIKPEIEIKEVSEKEYIKVKTEEIEVKTNSVTGLVQDEEGMSVSNLELSINKGNEEIRRTYTDENGRYVFSDVEEGKYTIKVEEENYELKEIKEVEVIGGITENIIVKKIKPYEIEVKKYISKIKLNNNGKEIEYEYGKLNKVNQTVKNLKNLSGEIEYKIEIKNTGEKSGEITKIEEEVTEGLKFKKEKNSEWEEKNGKIINRSLEGIKLKAGEEKEITLKLDIEKTDEARSYLQKVTAKGEVYQNVVYILGGKEYKKEKVLDGEKIEEPNINQENFKGWYTDKNYTNKYNFENSVTKDIILYGKIEESTKKYTVQYINEGKIIKEEELEEGSIINAPEVTKEGHTFIGWYEGEEKYDVYEPITRNLILESKYEINKYKVRFINEDESVLQEEILDYGSIPTYKKETPTKTRTEEYTYEFDKWTPEITKVTSDQEYKATYKKTKNKYTITYINEGTEYHKEILEYGSVITSIQDPTKEGHTFTGWYTKDNEKVSYPITITKNITLYSKYEINSYKVSYYNEGKKYIDDQKINYGENALKPNTNPSKIGYTFKYWSLKENGKEYEFSTKITKDITLYAVYEINKYTVTYINEGTEYHKETLEYGSVITSIQNPTKEGYTFTGWYTKDNEKVSYPITVTKNITLYSKYEINSYKVSYYNEGKKYIDDQKINYGENALKPNTNPSKIGYTFKYWSLKENGEEYEFSTKITKDITLYAVYEINKYTLTYINEGIEYHKETAEYGSVITEIQDPTKEGYTFTGWYTKDNEKVSYPITVTKNITLYSKYEINSYKVSYYNEGKKYIDDQKINYGENALKPNTNPSKIGYTFKYWSLKENGEEYEFSTKITKDITLYAVYEINKYTLTYINEGIEYHKETAEYGSVITSIQDPIKEGYTFIGWYDENNQKVSYPITVTEDITLHSKYEINTYTVSFYHNNEKYVENQKVNYGESAVKPSTDPTKEDYNFSGWVIKGTNNKYDFTSKVTKDIELESSFTAKTTYTVTFKIENEVILTENIIEGHKVTSKEAPYKKGYLFDKWYSDEELTTENNFDEKIMSDKTIYGKYNENKHTVTYMNEKDVYYTEEVLDSFTAKGPSTNPSKIGYTFKYWSLKENGEEYTFNSEITKNITLYAVYEINKYTVTYINEGSEYHKEELTYGSKHEKIEDPFKTGYTFIGWYNENEEKVEYPITVTKDITLHSKYNINKYTVTYINEGAKYIEDQQINYKEKAVKPDPNPSKIGYTFKYWSLKENGEEYNFNSEITKDTTLYAVYEINKYTVTYINEESEYHREELTYGSKHEKIEDPFKTGYTFIGWYNENEEKVEYPITVTKDITLHSKYEINKYTVTFNDEDRITTKEVNYNAKVEPVINQGKTGYTFKYWSKEKGGEEYNFNTPVTEDTTLYAVYEINKYTVTYINEESEYHKEELTYGSKHEKIEDPFKTGYTFIGWYNENEEKVEYPITVTKDITLHSKYNINKYTVTYINEGAKYIEDQQINYKEKAVKPDPNPSKIGYTFKYWSLKENGEEYNFNTLVTENITLYAVYNINKYTVTFKNYDGSTLQEETLKYGILPKYKGEEPTREKTKEYTYTFKGWDKEITEVTNNQEYIATYTETKNKYNVKFTNYDGSILQEETLEYGTLPVYKGEAPTREKTDEYTYTFKSWNKEITEVTDNEIYIAVYTEEKNKYTVIYMDGENEYTRKEVNYGETVSEEVISKDHNIYRGWTLDGNIYDFNTPVTKNITINSSFELVESPVIESTPIEWTKENVKVTISSSHNDYSYMYKIDDGEYQNYNGEFTVDKNCTVIAKSIKQNVESEITTKEITNIDKVLPEIKELTEENITTKSFDIKVKGQDNESGLSEIRIYKNDELMVSYPYTERLNEEKEETYSLTGLEENTTYKIKVELIDKVGNINVSKEKEITTKRNIVVARIIGRNNSLYESEEEYEPFESLENAITSCGSNECTIEMVLNTNESVNVLEGQEIKLELNGKTVSGIRDYTIENSGELIIDNDQEIGSITNTNGIGIKNIANGILQIGENEEPLSVSVAKPNIVGTTYGIYTEEETAKLKFYDGKIEGNVAIQGNVDDTPYLYNAKITNEGHQVATLSILAEAEAKITGGKYYTKLTNAVSESKIGTYKTEEQDIMSNFITPGLYGFDYDEETKSLISNNAKISGSTANSYIKIDLTTSENDKKITIDSLVSTYRHYGYVTITKSKTIPSANNTSGRIIYITAENSENSAQATTILEKGNIYYLHLGYAKSSSYNDYTNNEDIFKITNITLVDYQNKFDLDLSKDLITPGEYGFTYSDGILKSNNQNKDNTTANSYIKVDLTNYIEDQKIYLETEISSEMNADVGYITITDSETIPSYNSETGRIVYTSGGESKTYMPILPAGKISYIHFGYRKDGSVSSGTDTFTIKKFGIYNEIKDSITSNVTIKIPVLNENVDTVELIKDVTLSSPIEVASTKEMILDLNGKILTTTANDYVIKNSGNLTIIDSKYQKDTEKYQAEYEAKQAQYNSEYEEQMKEYTAAEKEYEEALKEYYKKLEEYTASLSVIDYDYTGDEQAYVVPEDGAYTLETWGASGGDVDSSNKGGYGGYSIGKVSLNKGDILYINVGGSGNTTTAFDKIAEGGYNGGGDAINTNHDCISYLSGSGGGATHVATKSGLLSTLSDSLDSILIVSGGGGGSNNCGYGNYGSGGSGGGVNGVSADSSGGSNTYGLGATQETFGCDNRGGKCGSFGQGYSGTKSQYGTGGGSGLYGGGAGKISGSGGGSGYIGNAKLTDKVMYCYNCQESNDKSTKTVSTTNVSSDATANSAKIGNGHVRITKGEVQQSNTTKFDYTGNEQEYVVPEDGKYKLETWGAQGGDIISSYSGGYGGYSVGTVSLKKGDTLYLNVGGQGYSSKTMSSNTKTTGGYNGGGYGYQTTNLYASGGGGATHIATKSGLLSTLSDSLDSILIVSGGGSGAYGYGSYFWNGNSGGGVIGGYSNDSTSAGTQTSGFEFGQAGDSENKSNWASTTNRSGGGGGLYGGQSYWGEKGSGGGSGYIGNEKLTNKAMYCYSCEESNDKSTKTIRTTNVSSNAITNSAKIGNGYAKITLLNESSVEEPEKPEMPDILRDDVLDINKSTFTYSGNGQMSEIDSGLNFYVNNSGNKSVTYYNEKISVGKSLTAKLNLSLYQNWSSSNELLGTAYIGFATTNAATTDDFVSYVTKDINSYYTNAKAEDIEITVNEPGEYYFKIVLYHNNNTGAYTVYSDLYSFKLSNKPELRKATLQEATYTGTITSSTNSIIYNDMNANLMLKEGILELNKSGEYNAITNDGTLSVLENSSINTKQANNRGIYNGYNGNIKDSGTTINQSSSGYGIYSVSKVDDGFSNITFNLNSGVGFYNAYGNIVVNNIKTTGSNGVVYTNTGTLTINDSSLDSKIVTNGTVTINNSTHILNNYSYDITDDFSGALTLNNCDFQYNITYYAIWGRSNTLNINNSTVTISHSSRYETSIRGVSNLNINNSTIKRIDGNSWTLIDAENVLVTGNSTITANGAQAINGTNVTIGEKDGNITSYPYITSNNYLGVIATNLYIYDGTITAPKENAIRGAIKEIEENSELNQEYEDNNEKYTLVTPTDVAQINDNKYTSLESAINAVQNDETIELLRDTVVIDGYSIDSNKKFKINLNTHKITAFNDEYLFDNKGDLTILDSNTENKGIITNSNGLLFTNTGTILLDNISLNSANNDIINNYGTINFNKINSYTNTNGNYLQNHENATATINDSTLGLNSKIINDNIMNVNNTTINGGNLINNSGKTLKMDKSTAYINVNNSGIYNSNGSSYTSSFSNNSGGVFVSKGDNYTIDISNSGQLDLYDVTTTSWKSMSNNSSGVINIYSGTINTFVYNDNTSTLNIYDGTIASRIANRNQAIVNFIGGTMINTGSDSIVNEGTGTINIGTKDGTVNLDSPTITTNRIGVTNNANGKLNFYDGKITGSTAISGPVTEIEDGYDIIKETIDGKEVKYLAKQAVAQIESTGEKYNTIQEAIDAATNTGETIKLLRELTTISSTSTITIPEDKDIILDLNGYKILQNNTPFITNNGTFTLKDSSETTTNSNGYTVYSGTITSSVGNVIENNGTFNYVGGTITSSNAINGLITNNGTMNMNGGYINPTGGSTNLIINNNKLLMNDGTIYADMVKNVIYNKGNAILTINNTTFNVELSEINVITSAILNEGTTYVYGGTYKIRSNYYYKIPVYLYNEKNAVAVIKGLTNLTGDIHHAVYNDGNIEIIDSVFNNGYLYNVTGNMNLTNVTSNYSTSSSEINANGIIESGTGIININSGEYNVPIENNNSGIINIKSGTYTKGVKNTSTGTINIGTKGDLTEEGELNVSKTNPNITNSNGYGLTISRGKVNFYDGIISGTSGAISGTVNEIEDGYEIISGKTEDGKESKYLALLPVAKIVSTNEEYYNLQDAIDAVTKTGETIKIIRKYTTLNTLETITIPEDKNIIIDLNGYTIEQNNENFLVNNGTLKITDSSENNTSSILMNKNKFIENNKDLTIENIKISTENISLTNAITNNSNMIMKNSNISGKIVSNIINNIGTLNMKNSSITITAGGQGNGINNSGTLTMEDSSLTLGLAGNMKIGVNNSGTLNITNGNYSVSNYYDGTKSEVYYNTGKINITGGTYNLVEHGIMLISNSEKDSKIDGITLTSSYETTITNRGSGTLDIENSTITSVESSGSGIVNLKSVIISNSVLGSYDKGTINIYGSTINGGRIENNSLINIYDINLNLTDDTIRNYRTINIYGGTLVSSNGSPITNCNNNGIINIGTKDGNVSTESPVITGKTYGVSNSDSGKVNFYDGIVSGETGAFYGTVNEVEPGYKVVTNKVDTLTSATLALVGDDEKVAVLNGINFSSLQDAINSASDTTESIITLYANIVFDNNITVPANKNIKLYLNGYTLNKGSYDFTGEGKITVIDGTSTNALASIIENVKEVLNIGGINKNIIIYEMDDGSAISSESTYKLYKDNEEVMLEEDAIGIYSVGNSNDEIRLANKKIYINELPKGKYKLIGDNNKEVKFEIDESGKIIGNVKENTKETSKIVSTAVAELIIMIQTGIEKVNYIMIILTLLVTISSLLYIVKKVNVKES